MHYNATKPIALTMLSVCTLLLSAVLHARTQDASSPALPIASFELLDGISDNPLAGKWQLTQVVYKDHSPEAQDPGLAWFEALKTKAVFTISEQGMLEFPPAIHAKPAQVSIEGNEIVLKWTGGNASTQQLEGSTKSVATATSMTYYTLELKGNTMVWRYDSPNVQQVFTFKRL